jgi:hypothetical protein
MDGRLFTHFSLGKRDLLPNLRGAFVAELLEQASDGLFLTQGDSGLVLLRQRLMQRPSPQRQIPGSAHPQIRQLTTR